MKNERIIEMIDEHLTEPHSINREWVEALTVCKQALIDKESITEIFDKAVKYKEECEKKDTEIDILIRKNETLKDEISRLQNILVGFMSEVEMWSNKYDVDISNIHRIPLLAKEDFNIRNKIKMKGIKEFWHKLKQKKKWDIDMPDHIYVSDGDNLLKELTE